MTQQDAVQIAIGLIALALMVLIIGYRIYDGGAPRDVGPLIKIKSFWVWLTLVVLGGAALGAGVFFVVTGVSPPA